MSNPDLDKRVLRAIQGFSVDPITPLPPGSRRMKLATGDEGRCVYVRAMDAVNADGEKTVGLIAVMRTFTRLKKQGLLKDSTVTGIYWVAVDG